MSKSKTKSPTKTVSPSLKHTWDLSPLYQSDTDPKIEADLVHYRQLSYQFIDKWKDRTDYLKSPQILKEALTNYEAWLEAGGSLGDIGYYFSLRSAQEENNPQLKARLNQLTDLATKIENDAQFFTMRLAKVPATAQKKFLCNKILAHYHHFLKRLFDEAKYLLSEPEEKIMNLKSNPAHSQWIQMTSSLLAKETRPAYDKDGKLKSLPLSELSSLSSHSSQKIRDKAAAAMNDILSSLAGVAEAEINAILLNKKINDELRGLSRPDTSRHLSDDVETEVVDALLVAVESFFTTSQRYYKLKAKLLGKKRLAYHERNVPYGQTRANYSYEQAVEIVGRTFQNLDQDFYRHFQNFVDRRQIDVWPKPGRSAGAFCASGTPKAPVYILLNHTNLLSDVLTLAHEAGHGINDEFMKTSQGSLYFGTPLVTAEVASTFTEDFVLTELMKSADDETRLSLQLAKLNDEISTVMRQVAAYRFEQELHLAFRTEGYLSYERIGAIFTKHMKAYMGPAVEQSVGSDNWWIYWGHFRSFFYVYSYASGIIISKAMQAKVKGNPDFMVKVKNFLRAGSSATPSEIFDRLGINIREPAFWQTGLKEISDLLVDTEKLAKKLGQV